jgi:hypothetical protein
LGNKILIICISFFLLGLCFPAKVSATVPATIPATDMTVTCDNIQCVKSGSGLFNQTNIAPGYSVIKSVLIDNTNNSDSCNLHLQATRQGGIQNPDLAGKIISLIKSNGIVYFGDDSGNNPKSFADLFGQDVFLGTVNSNSSRIYSWRADFLASSGNDYQAKSVNFSFNLNFVCGTAPTVTPSVTPTATTTIITTTPLLFNILGLTTDNISLTPTGTPAITPSLLGNTDNTNNGAVLGLACDNPGYNWWVVLLIQAVLTALVLAFKGFKPAFKKIWLLPVLLAILSQLVHNYYGCGCSTGIWCGYYWFLNLILVAISSFGYYLLTSLRTKSS